MPTDIEDILESNRQKEAEDHKRIDNYYKNIYDLLDSNQGKGFTVKEINKSCGSDFTEASAYIIPLGCQSYIHDDPQRLFKVQIQKIDRKSYLWIQRHPPIPKIQGHKRWQFWKG